MPEYVYTNVEQRLNIRRDDDIDGSKAKAMRLVDLVAWAQAAVDAVPAEYRETAEVVISNQYPGNGFGLVYDVCVRYQTRRPLTAQEQDARDAREYERLKRKFEPKQ